MKKFNLRRIYIDKLIENANVNDRIVCLDADSKEATMVDQFAANFPERCFSFGIAEQDMVSAAGGMASMGLIPFVNTYGMFIAMRALDQVRNSIAYPNMNVKFVLSHTGLDVGSDGVTHQLTEDIAIFRCIPNIKLLQPADSIEMAQMVDFAIKVDGPIIIKAGKSSVPNVHNNSYKWHYGVPSLVAEGENVAIISNGIMVFEALTARKQLMEKYGICPMVINCSSLTDISNEHILDMTDGVKLIVTVEDHSVFGGIGGIIAEILSEFRPTKIVRIGLKGVFAESGSPHELFRKYNMDAKAIVETIQGANLI